MGVDPMVSQHVIGSAMQLSEGTGGFLRDHEPSDGTFWTCTGLRPQLQALHPVGGGGGVNTTRELLSNAAKEECCWWQIQSATFILDLMVIVRMYILYQMGQAWFYDSH